jgi:hypothetical protein
MSTSSGSIVLRILRSALSGTGRFLREAGKRCYALILVLVVLWLSWQAIAYLVKALMLPARPPSKIVDVPTRLKLSTLMRSQSAAGAAPATPHLRTPLSHYHRLDEGFQADPLNGCTASQCHAPLPHGKNKADRAFLNMHSTSIHCGVCHVRQDQKPLPLVWYDLKTGDPRPQAPAMLQAYAWLTRTSITGTNSFTLNDQAEIVRLLRDAANESYSDADLVSLADHLNAVRVTSAEFNRLVKVTRDALQGHFRGEYGAKLAQRDPRTQKPFLGKSGDARAERDFLARRNVLSDSEKKALLERIHPPRRNPTLRCKDCHRAEGSLVDLPSLGYPPARIQAISSPQVTSAIDNIVEGQSFYLPDFLRNQP